MINCLVLFNCLTSIFASFLPDELICFCRFLEEFLNQFFNICLHGLAQMEEDDCSCLAGCSRHLGSQVLHWPQQNTTDCLDILLQNLSSYYYSTFRSIIPLPTETPGHTCKYQFKLCKLSYMSRVLSWMTTLPTVQISTVKLTSGGKTNYRNRCNLTCMLASQINKCKQIEEEKTVKNKEQKSRMLSHFRADH